MNQVAGDRWEAGDAYEAYMGRWSRPLAPAFVEWLDAKPAGHWLDVGCGTGALTSAICERGSPKSIVACDASEPFVGHARSKLSDARVSFVVASAESLPARENGFDVIVSGLVLNFLAEPALALAHFRERVRTGGTIAAYVWDYAEGMEFLRMFWEEATALDPNAATQHEGARFPLCNAAALTTLFEGAGLARVETTALVVPTDFTSFADFWAPFLRGTGPGPSYVASLDAPSQQALKERLEKRLRKYESEGRIRLKARAFAVRGASI